jgi:phytoene dehydrogenase-like protein
VPVERIATTSGRVDGVVLATGERLPTDVVVCDADASLLYGSLLSQSSRGRLKVPSADSFSGFVVLLGVRRDSAVPAHHGVLFGAAPYDREFEAVFGTPGRPVDDPVLYVNAPDDPATAPGGHQAWYLLVNAPRHGRNGEPGAMDWSVPRVADRYADQLLVRLAERGLPVGDRVVFREVRTPLDLARESNAPGGSIYGQVMHGPLATFRRPANRTPVRGLFLVGGSTHPGGGLPLVALSGRIAAGLVGAA